MRGELRRLAAELRARSELSEPEDWRAAPAPAPSPVSPEERVKPAPIPAADEAPISKIEKLAALEAAVRSCRDCPLGTQRLNPAFGVGSPSAEAMFIGEGPGFEEDRRGEPFVGKAGQLLDKIIESIGLSRKTVYIANIVKCHPMIDPQDPEKRGNDRPPSPEEIAACRHYLDEQIRLIRPRFLIALGGVAAKVMIGTEEGIMRLRGRWHEYGPDSLPLLPTFHPAFLLRSPERKRDVWEDMKELKRRLENRQG